MYSIVIGIGATGANSQPKLATGTPPKLRKLPAGLFETKEPAKVVLKKASVLVPISGGSKRPCPRLFNCAKVAPVAPVLLSKVIPAQMFELVGLNVVSPVVKYTLTPTGKAIEAKLYAATRVPGPPPAPSASQKRTLARAFTTPASLFATEKENLSIAYGGAPIKVISSATNCVIVFPA